MTELNERVDRLEERVNIMEVTQGKFEKSIEYFDRTISKLEKVIDKIYEDQHLNIVQWIKKNFVTLLLGGALILYMLDILPR